MALSDIWNALKDIAPAIRNASVELGRAVAMRLEHPGARIHPPGAQRPPPDPWQVLQTLRSEGALHVPRGQTVGSLSAELGVALRKHYRGPPDPTELPRRATRLANPGPTGPPTPAQARRARRQSARLNWAASMAQGAGFGEQAQRMREDALRVRAEAGDAAAYDKLKRIRRQQRETYPYRYGQAVRARREKAERDKAEQTHRIRQQARAAASHLASAASGTGSMFSQVGNLIGGASDLVGMVPGSQPAVAVMKFAEGLFKSVDMLKRWTDQLHEGNMRFADLSAAMASVEARQEVRDIRLSQQRGDRRANSAEFLAQGRNRLDIFLSSWQDLGAVTANNIVGGGLLGGFAILDNLAGSAGTLLQQLPNVLMALQGANMNGGEGEFGEAQWIINDGADWAQTWGRPDAFFQEPGA